MCCTFIALHHGNKALRSKSQFTEIWSGLLPERRVAAWGLRWWCPPGDVHPEILAGLLCTNHEPNLAAALQQKLLSNMSESKEALLVSHNMSWIRTGCDLPHNWHVDKEV